MGLRALSTDHAAPPGGPAGSHPESREIGKVCFKPLHFEVVFNAVTDTTVLEGTDGALVGEAWAIQDPTVDYSDSLYEM